MNNTNTTKRTTKTRKNYKNVANDTTQQSTKQLLTVKEFRMWLEGVIEMQEPGWIPDSRQWAKILDKIYDIMDIGPNIQPTYFQQDHYRPVANVQQSPLSNISEQESATPAVPSSSVQYRAPSAMSTVSTPSVANEGKPFANGSASIPVKTPNIDSSSGYDTPFV